ncbi:unnamed protein product [Orchesella dallaii]
MAGARPKGPLATSADDEVDIDLQEDQQTSRASSKRVSIEDELLFGEKEEHYSRHQAASDDEEDDDDDDDELDSHARSRSSQPTSSTSQSQAMPSLNEPDSPIFTPFGSPMSDISDINSIRKWTGEVKKMLLEDQRSTENRAKSEKRTDIEFLSVWSPMRDDLDKTESALDLEDFDTGGGTTSGSEQDFSVVLPTHAELAEKYSEELVLKERLLLQKEAKIMELEKSQRDLSRSLEDCEKELKQKINSEVVSLEKLKISLEEKDKSIMETSERLRQVTESYNSSEQRWKEQETFLENQITRLKEELEGEKVGVKEELVELKEEKKRLEIELETVKEENGRLKRGMDEEKEELERELEVLREEKEGLKEEIEELKDRLMVSEREVEIEKEEKERVKEELEEKEERNKSLEKDVKELKGRGEEAVGVLEKEKERLEEELQRLKKEVEQVEDEKVRWEVEMQLLKDQLEEMEREKKEEVENLERLRKEEKEELERKQEEIVMELKRKQEEQLEELERIQKEQMEEIQRRKEEEVEQASAPLNFFTGDEEQAAPTSMLFGVPPPLEDEDWQEERKELQDRIAELELEKGNLLLKLVDVDDSDEDKQQVKEKEIKEDIHAAKLKESEDKMEQMEEELTASQDKIIFLEKELEELKRSESERIETALTTIAWEEKLDLLQKENDQLSEELLSHRKGADELSTRYEALEQKYIELEETSEKQKESAAETAAAAAEALALVEIDKCDGWSDDTPQIPDADEGFTEDPLIAELKEQLDEKDREISLLSEKHLKLEEIIQRSNEQMQNYEQNLEKMGEERKLNTDKLNEVLKELENVRQQMIQKEIEQQEQTQAQLEAAAAATLPVADGWGDDIPVLLDDPSPSLPTTSTAESLATQKKLEELEQSLNKTREEFTTVSTKCHALEEKLKKAMKVIKQRNDKIAEYKNRLGDDPMNMSISTTSMMESSLVQVVQEAPMVQTRAVAFELGAGAAPPLQLSPSSAPLSPALKEESEKLRKELEEREYRIKELESFVQLLQEREMQAQASAGGDQFILQQKDMEISSLRNEMSQLVFTLNSKNEEVESLMRACGDMQRSLDDKVELLNDSVTKKDEEVREAISQYEECLKNTTLNVSQLTQELEEKIRMINQLQASLQEAQEALILTQNQFEASKARETQQNEVEKESLVLQLQALREENERVNTQLGELQVEHGGVREALERAEQEKARMREDSNCIQNEFGAKNGELQLKISNLMDQLNDCESAVSVMEARVKEADEKEQEWRSVVEDKGKALEQVEQQLFVKNEEVLRLEERLRGEEQKGGMQVEQLQAQLNQMNESYIALQTQYGGLHQEYTRISEEFSQKCLEIQEKEVAGGAEVVALRGTLQGLEGTLQSYVEALNNANLDIQGKQQEIGNMQGVIAQYEEKLFNGALELEEERRKVEEGRNKLKIVEEEAIRKEAEGEEIKGEKEALRKEVEERREREERNRAEVAALKEETGRLNQENGRLNQLVIRYQNVEESLNKYLEDLNGATEELGRKNGEVRELQEKVKEGEINVQRMRERMEGLSQDVSTREQMLQDKSEEVSRLQQELRQVRESSEENSSKYTRELLSDLEEKGREISDLRFELDEGILQERSLKQVISEKDMEIEALRNEMSSKEGEIDRLKLTPVLSPEDQSLQQKVIAMERKVDLLQGKLAEVEESEVKCYEDFSRLKILRTELEMDNLRMSGELEQLRRSLQDGDNDPKYKSMENQLILMSKTLEDRDKLCRDLMKNVSQLQEQKDALQKALPPPAEALYQEYQLGNEEDTLENRVIQQDREIFSLRIDLEREKKIRELYEGQLFLATSKKQFETERERRSTSSYGGGGGGGGWFGLSELFSPSPPSPPRRLSPRPSTPHLAPPQPHGFGTPTSTQGRHMMMPPQQQQLPMTPSTPFTPALFGTSPSSSSPGNVFLPQVLQPSFEAAASGDQSVSLPPASLFMERDPNNSL